MSLHRQATVMVVDDSHDILDLLATSLTINGYRVITCTHGHEALRAALHNAPDLILLDISLPDINGFEVCRLIRQQPTLADTPVVFLTARSQVMDKVHGLDIGGNDYITKPFQMDEFLARIRVALRAKSLQDSLRQTNEELREQANTDPLTGLYNRRYLDGRLEQEIARSRTFGYALSCAIIDLDFFKAVNDTYGHLWGNEVLLQVAHILRRYTRDLDVVARYGGEEFVVLLLQADEQGAIAAAEKIRMAVLNHNFGTPDATQELHLSASVGVSTVVSAYTDAVQLLHYADMALYRAKSMGRNMVCVGDSASNQPVT